MKLLDKLTCISLSIMLSTAVHSAYAQSNTQSAEVIVLNADIRTVDPSKPKAQSFAIRDGKFIAVGSEFYIKQLQDKNTKVIDAQGRTIIPGLTDAHTHFSSGMEIEQGVDLYGMTDRKEWLKRIAERDKQLPKGQWMTGGRGIFH